MASSEMYKDNVDFDRGSFASLLSAPGDSLFTLDLSNLNLIQCIEQMCEVKKKLHPKIVQNYHLAIYQLEALQEEFNCVIEPIRVNGLFWQMFVPWLASERGLKYSSIKTIKAQILSALNWASKYGAKLSGSYNETDIPKYHGVNLALTVEELERLYNTDFNGKEAYSNRTKTMYRINPARAKTLEKVRDHLLLSCALGQRYSDMSRIKPEYFKDGVFTMVQQKTGNRCRVDILKLSYNPGETLKILEKYGYYAPYSADISDYNSHLKEVLRMAGGTLLSDVTIESKINGKIVSETKQKYKLMASHTARRTFITYNELRGIPRRDIMKGSGHSTEGSYVKYICDDVN